LTLSDWCLLAACRFRDVEHEAVVRQRSPGSVTAGEHFEQRHRGANGEERYLWLHSVFQPNVDVMQNMRLAE
jgi:hypothetical protein